MDSVVVMKNKESLHTRTGKKVLMCSAGMDSYIINYLEKPDVLVFVDNNSNYSKIERAYLEDMKLDNLVIVDNFIDHSTIELDNMIIPGRNLNFAMIGAHYGEHIILGATAGDRSTDKDHTFSRLTSELLSHIYAESHWCTKGKIHIDLAYKNWTKQDLVTKFVEEKIKEGLDAESAVRSLVEESFSCYHPNEFGQCNRCKPDTRKYLSILGATGIDISKYYERGNKPSEFFTDDVIEEWISSLENDLSRGRESVETVEVLKKLKKQ